MSSSLILHAKRSSFYNGYIFDLDSTVFLGDALLPDAQRAVGKRTVFLSNNPTHTRFDYAAKLTRLGLPTRSEDIITSSKVMVDFLKRTLPNACLFVVGEQPLSNDLRAAGFALSDDIQEIDAVIASIDRTFVYAKLQIVFDL